MDIGGLSDIGMTIIPDIVLVTEESYLQKGQGVKRMIIKTIPGTTELITIYIIKKGMNREGFRVQHTEESQILQESRITEILMTREMFTNQGREITRETRQIR